MGTIRISHTATAKERLDSRSRKNGDCIEWTGERNVTGYGRLSIKNRKRTAHRLAWEVAFGEIPAGLFVCHKCDNKICINPEHLFLGTHADNMLDMKNKQRRKGFGGSCGESHPRSRLTDSDVIAIRDSQKSNAETAKEFGVTSSHVWAIRNRSTWKHI